MELSQAAVLIGEAMLCVEETGETWCEVPSTDGGQGVMAKALLR